MRYRRLLFVAVLSLLSCATPVYAALGIEPRRLPPAMEGAMDMVDAKLPIPELDQAVSNYDPEQRDYRGYRSAEGHADPPLPDQ